MVTPSWYSFVTVNDWTNQQIFSISEEVSNCLLIFALECTAPKCWLNYTTNRSVFFSIFLDLTTFQVYFSVHTYTQKSDTQIKVFQICYKVLLNQHDNDMCGRSREHHKMQFQTSPWFNRIPCSLFCRPGKLNHFMLVIPG